MGTFLLIVILIVLVSSGGFISYTIWQNNQAPQDASAGGGGGACCRGVYDSNSQTCNNGPVGTATPCCENDGYLPFDNDTNSFLCDSSPCYNYRSGGTFIADECKIPTSGTADVCGIPTSEIDGWTNLGTNCSAGAECPAPTTSGQVAVCWKGQCKSAPIEKCFWYGGAGNNILNCDCGCPTFADICKEGVTGVQTGRCSKCNNNYIYDCGGSSTPVCGDANYVPGAGECSPPGTATCDSTCKPIIDSEDPVCGDDDYVPGVGECSPPGTATCDSTCKPIIDSEDPVCGDDDYVPGVGECSPPGTASCDANCKPIIVITSTDITLLKESSSVCVEAENENEVTTQTINYTITVTNTGNQEATFTSLIDQLPSGLTPSQVSNISNGGILNTSTSGRFTITWPENTLNAKEVVKYRYTIVLNETQINAYPTSFLENVVTLEYEDNGTPKEVSFTNREPLECNSIDLPDTALPGDKMYYIAILLIVFAVVVYRQGLFRRISEVGLYGAQLIFDKNSRRKLDQVYFEKNIKEEITHE